MFLKALLKVLPISTHSFKQLEIIQVSYYNALTDFQSYLEEVYVNDTLKTW